MMNNTFGGGTLPGVSDYLAGKRPAAMAPRYTPEQLNPLSQYDQNTADYLTSLGLFQPGTQTPPWLSQVNYEPALAGGDRIDRKSQRQSQRRLNARNRRFQRFRDIFGGGSGGGGGASQSGGTFNPADFAAITPMPTGPAYQTPVSVTQALMGTNLPGMSAPGLNPGGGMPSQVTNNPNLTKRF